MLFLAGILITELFAAYSNSKLVASLNLANIRSEQVSILSELEVKLVESVLGGMDSIIDKDQSKIGADVINGMKEANQF